MVRLHSTAVLACHISHNGMTRIVISAVKSVKCTSTTT